MISIVGIDIEIDIEIGILSFEIKIINISVLKSSVVFFVVFGYTPGRPLLLTGIPSLSLHRYYLHKLVQLHDSDLSNLPLYGPPDV